MVRGYKSPRIIIFDLLISYLLEEEFWILFLFFVFFFITSVSIYFFIDFYLLILLNINYNILGIIGP